MKTLLITAHPAEYGFTHTIADTYKTVREEVEGSIVEIYNLYDSKNHQDFLAFNSLDELQEGDIARTKVQEKIQWADELVFVYPMWWSAMPAILKNFMDINFSAHFAFEYKDGKSNGLLKGKTARVFVTADGPKMMYTIFRPFVKLPLTMMVLKFCGITAKSFDIFTNMREQQNDTAREKMLEVVRKRARS